METIRITLYGSLAEAVGREAELPVEPGATIAEVRRRLIQLHPATAAILSRPAVRACLNDEMVDDERAVPAGAELAFFPPLSGG